MRTRFLAIAALVMAIAAAIQLWWEVEPVTRVDLTRRAEVKAPEAVPAITYAYLPQYSHSTSYLRHRALVEYLQKATGLAIRQVFPDTFEAHRRMVERGEIDISFSNPMTYVLLAQSGARAFAGIVEPSGRATFRGQVIARADNTAIKTEQDCRGKRWIAVDPYSAGGYLFVLGHFHDKGLTESDFAEIAFAPGPGGKQEKAVLGVYAGRYDIASIREGTLGILEGKVDLSALKVVATTREYPSWVYAARKGLDPDIVRRIASAMFALSENDPEHERILAAAGMRGIIPTTDRDYDPCRELFTTLRLDPSKVGAE